MKTDKLTRLFFIVNKLLEKPYTVNQIANMLTNQFSLDKLPSKHMINDDLNKIKKAGFKLETDKQSKEFSYKIKKTPFQYTLDKENIDLIQNIFSTYSNNPVLLENFFQKISTLLQFDLKDVIPEHDVSKYKNKEIYFDIKNILQKAIHDSHLTHRKVKFNYLSAENDAKGNDPITHETFPHRIEITEKKIEKIWVYNRQPNTPKQFNINRIVDIPELIEETVEKDYIASTLDYAKFRLYPPASRTYNLCTWLHESKEIEDPEKEIVIIRTPYYTAFDLFQKIMKYGEYAQVLEPLEARDMIKERISKMLKIYDE